jgi:hypothetical protein
LPSLIVKRFRLAATLKLGLELGGLGVELNGVSARQLGGDLVAA